MLREGRGKFYEDLGKVKEINLDNELKNLLINPILLKNDDKVCLEIDNPLLIDYLKHERRRIQH